MSETQMTSGERLWMLRVRPSVFGVQRRDGEIAEIFRELVATGDQWSVMFQAPYFITDPSAEVRRATADALHQIFSAIPPVECLHFSERLQAGLRWWDDCGTNNAWKTLAPSKLAELAADPDTRVSVLGLISFHRNGFVRHEAVRQLSQIHDGTELPFLLVRQNDWVGVLSAEARVAVEQRLHRDYLPHFLAQLPLVLHLLSFQRHDHSETVARVVDRLLHPDFDVQLRAAIQNPNRQVRRLILRIGLQTKGEQLKRVVRHGLTSTDPTMRLSCLKRLPECHYGTDLREALAQHRIDRFMPIRREALLIEAHHFPEAAVEMWRSALLDSHRSLRELAQLQFAKLTGQSSAGHYRACLISNPNSIPALAGLGETGEASDLSAIRNSLKSPLPKQRSAAAIGLSRIGGPSAIPELLALFPDDSRAVVRTVLQLLEPSANQIPGAQLLAIVKLDHRNHVRRAALQLLFKQGKWASLPWLIRSAATRDGETAEFARTLIENWFSPPLCNRIFTQPTADERRQILEAFQQTGELPAAFRKTLNEWLSEI
ncbi:MAG: HEAT repeat domain-containing protein [Planctomycetes bacterium]|nr:HEAT repeat domain-containing protein [Planctomycetota bacterium]